MKTKTETLEKLYRALGAVSDVLSEFHDADWNDVTKIQVSTNDSLETVSALMERTEGK